MNMNNVYIAVFVLLSVAMFMQRFGVIDRLLGIRNVSANQAKGMIGEQGALVLDVRTGKEFAAVRIPEAQHIPLSELPLRLEELESYRGRPIVVSCRTGGTSAKACRVLKKHGHDAYNLKGGLKAWLMASYSVETAPLEE